MQRVCLDMCFSLTGTSSRQKKWQSGVPFWELYKGFELLRDAHDLNSFFAESAGSSNHPIAMPRTWREHDAEEIDRRPLALLLPLPNLVGNGPPRPGWMPWRLLNIMILMERVAWMLEGSERSCNQGLCSTSLQIPMRGFVRGAAGNLESIHPGRSQCYCLGHHPGRA